MIQARNAACAVPLAVLAAATAPQVSAQSFGTGQPVGMPAGGHAVAIADLNADGLLDVISAGLWHPQLPGGAFGPSQALPGSPGGTFSIVTADFNGDGTTDVALVDTAAHRAVWYANSGNGVFGSQSVLGTNLMAARTIAAADVTGNGLPDIVVGSTADNKLTLFQNLGGGAFASGTTLTTSAWKVWAVVIGDIDDDGILDIVVGCFKDAGIVAMRGVGNGGFAQPVLLSAMTDVRSLDLGDIDGDGRLDVAFATTTHAGWIRNTGALFFAPATHVASSPYIKCARLADIDRDGHLDLIWTSQGWSAIDGTARWHRGLGGGSFGTAEEFGPAGKAVAIADLNGDGFPDIVHSKPGGLHWYPNQTRNDCNKNGIPDTLEIATGLAQDCNGNNVPDACELTDPFNDKNHNGILDACELALTDLIPAQTPAATGSPVSLAFFNVPNGPATLRLGALALPFVALDGAGSVVVPPLAASSSSDVVVDAWIEWNGGLDRTVTLPDAFRWIVPKAGKFVPPAVPYDGPSSVAVELTDNVVKSGAGVARFGTAPPQLAYWFPVGSSTVVTTTAPPQQAPGDYPIELEITSQGVKEICRIEGRGLIYLGPGIQSMSATSGYQAGGESITFELVGFAPGLPVQVAFGAATTTGVPVGFLAKSTLTVATPFGSVPGVVDVVLTQQGASGPKIVTSPAAFEFLPPSIGTLSMAAGPLAGGQPMTATVAGFQPGLVTVRMGGSVTMGTVQGSGGQQQVSWTTVAGANPGVTQVRFTQGVLDAIKPAAYEFKQPLVLAVAPPKGAWYVQQELQVSGVNFAPNVPATVAIGGQGALPATVESPDRVSVLVPPGFLAGAGPLALTVSQASIPATLQAAWTSLPSLAVQVAGRSVGGGVISFEVDSLQGGVAYILISPTLSPVLIPLAGIHFGLGLDPVGLLELGAGGLLTQPTLAVPFGPGVIPAGLTVRAQALVGEIGPLGLQLSFTQVRTLTIP